MKTSDLKNLKQPPLINVLQRGYVYFPVALLTAFLVDIPSLFISKFSHLQNVPGGLEDNFIVDGTSFAWMLVILVTLCFGLISGRLTQNLAVFIRGVSSLIPWCLPFGLFASTSFIATTSLSATLQVMLPVAHLLSLWIWFVIFRQCFTYKRFLFWILIAFAVFAAMQLLAALAIIPGTQFDFASYRNPKDFSGSSWLISCAEAGWCSDLEIQNGKVNLYERPWLYVIDQWLQGKSVPFSRMAESGFHLCAVTWIYCQLNVSFRQYATSIFWLVYPLCILSAMASFSRTGIWGSFLIVLTVAFAVTRWSGKNVILWCIGLIFFGSVIGLLYLPYSTEVYVNTNKVIEANFGNGLSEISVRSGSKLITLFDYSYHVRIEEFRWLFNGKPIQEIILGSGIAPQFSHSVALTFVSMFGLFGFALVLIPIIALILTGIKQYNSVHVLTALFVFLLNMLLVDTLSSWLIVFPIMIVLGHEANLKDNTHVKVKS